MKGFFTNRLVCIFSLAVVFLGCQSLVAQVIGLQINNDAVYLTEEVFIAGGCFDVENAIASGGVGAIGTFSDAGQAIGINAGIILSTGSVLNAAGPNSQTNYTTNFNLLNSDPDLEMIIDNSAIPIQDVTILEFDFTPTADFVTFEYVFASEEYCDFVNTLYNDVFGFFISGPGINGPFSNGAENIALIPGTADFVAINNVNHITNSTYYVDNIPLGDPQINGCPSNYPNLSPVAADLLEFDGFTNVISASAAVIPCETYHIKLVVGDVTDGQYDSAVFLKANSFEAGETVIVDAVVPSTNSDQTFEGCSDAYFLFQRFGAELNNPMTVELSIASSSTADQGQDFAALPSSVTFGPGETSVVLPVIVIEDAVMEGEESLTLELESACSCNTTFSTLFIQDNPPLEGSLNSLDVCEGESVTLAPEIYGGLPPYTFLWSTGASSPTTTLISDSDQTVSLTVTDACGATLSLKSTIQITPIPSVQFTGEIPFCGDEDFVQLPIFLEGNPPWELIYSIDGMIQESVIMDEVPFMLPVFTPGDYMAVNLESNGCAGILNGEAVVLDNDFHVVSSSQNVSCTGNQDGQVLLDISGGAAPYVISWEDGSSLESRFDLPPGNYTVTIQDGNGCVVAETVEIAEPEPLFIDLTLQSLSCYGAEDGQIEVEVTGGIPPYAFQINDGDFQSENLFQELQAGDHMLKVKDENDCTVQFPLQIHEPDLLEASFEFLPPACLGMPSGIVEIFPTGGTGGYLFKINDGSFQAEAVFDSLQAGQHSLEIIDENGCTFLQSFDLESGDPFSVNLNIISPSCASMPDGSIEVLVEGGQAPFLFMLNTDFPQAGNIFDGLFPGNYQILVEDQTGCQVVVSTLLENPGASVLEIQGPSHVCEGQQIALEAIGEFEQYYWSNGSSGASTLVSEGGHYEVTAVDSDNCLSLAHFWLHEVSSPEIEVAGDSILCSGATTVLNLMNDPDSVLWSDGSTTDFIIVDQPGNYGITIWDEFGCSAEATINVLQVPVVSVAISGSLTFCEQGSTVLYAMGDFLDWQWNDGSLDPFLEVTTPGEYHVSVHDIHGCAGSDTVNVHFSDSLSPEIMGSEGICPGDVLALNVQQNFEHIEWSTGDTLSTILVDQPGVYTITVNDGNECFGQDTFEVAILPEVWVDITGNPVFCSGEEVTLGLSGEFPGYSWSTGSLGPSITTDQPGWYFVTVTNEYGCQGRDSVYLEQLLPEIVEITKAVCAGNALWFNEQLLDQPGVYYDTLFAGAQNGCDSVTILNLEIITPVVDSLLVSIEEGESVFFNNDWLFEAGVYADTLVSLSTHCDSVVILVLEVEPYLAVYDTLQRVLCNGEQFEFNGQLYQTSGQFSDTIFSNAELITDTIFILDVEVYPQETSLLRYQLCGGDSIFYNDVWYFGDTVFIDTLMTVHGCDSIVTTTLAFSDLDVEIAEQLPPVCFGDASGALEIRVIGSTAGYEILWNTGESQSRIENLKAGDYAFTVTDALGCVITSTIALEQPQEIKAAVSSHLDCQNPGKAYLKVNHVSGGTSPYVYSTDGQNFHTSNKITVMAPAEHELIIEDLNGCQLRIAEILVDSINVIDFGIFNGYIHTGDSLQLLPFPNFEPVEILWTPAEWLSCDDCHDPLAFPEMTTEFSVAMKTIDGCWVDNQITVYVDRSVDVFAPTAFSPNGDGINDYFTLYAGPTVMAIKQLRIFDRWGNLVYLQKNLVPNVEKAGWDGTFKGKLLDHGVFVFTAEILTLSGESIGIDGEFLLLNQ